MSAAASQINGSPINAVGSRDVDALEQHDAEPLGLEAPGTIVGLLDLEVASELVALAAREADLGPVDVGPGGPEAVSSTCTPV